MKSHLKRYLSVEFIRRIMVAGLLMQETQLKENLCFQHLVI